MKQYKVIGKHFDELKAGQEFITPSRTITESDVGLFAGLTGDYNPMHTDEVFAKKSAFCGRIVHGCWSSPSPISFFPLGNRGWDGKSLFRGGLDF